MFEVFASTPWLLIATVFVFSLLVGSFLNVVIHRLPIMLDKSWRADAREILATNTPDDVSLSSVEPPSSSNEAPLDPRNPDIAITPNGNNGWIVQLRAERAGNLSGRIYTLTATARNVLGSTTTVTATCTVPHDQGK